MADMKYAFEPDNAWHVLPKKEVFFFVEGYKEYLNKAKTEREAVSFIVDAAEKAGFKPKGNKQYITHKNKLVALIVRGKKPVESGVRIIAAHIDSPRLDLKQKPLYEDAESKVGLMETHYYGGLRQYHWRTIPLALHGVVITKTKTLTLSIGESESDPVFTVPDILPHLAKDQMDKKLNKAFDPEHNDILVGSIPVEDKKTKEKIKAALLERLHKEYGIEEQDFVSAELEVVPAFKSRCVGFDKSLVGGYGQDDSACAFTLLEAVLTIKNPSHTCIALFFDKEEIGSEGVTGAKSSFLEYVLRELGTDPAICCHNSEAISADVHSAITPNYKDLFEVKNSAALGNGVVIAKFGGAGGKYSSSDASAEYVAVIRTMLNNANIPWQTGELGKVGVGGGGTIAKYLEQRGIDTIDLGPPVLSMHSPFEIVSKADIYSTYLAYKEFFR